MRLPKSPSLKWGIRGTSGDKDIRGLARKPAWRCSFASGSVSTGDRERVPLNGVGAHQHTPPIVPAPFALDAMRLFQNWAPREGQRPERDASVRKVGLQGEKTIYTMRRRHARGFM